MTLNKVKITDGMTLSYINTDKFKSGILTFSLSVPYKAENAVCATLLSGMLKRGTEKYPDLAALSRRLDELYASSVDVRSSRIGKNINLTVVADMLDRRYIPDGTDILGGVLELIDQTLFHPRLEGGDFPASVFEQEKRFLDDSMNASINNTRAYASIRLNEMMFAHDSEYYTIEDFKKILPTVSAHSLAKFMRDTVQNAPIEVFYIGTESVDTLRSYLLSYFDHRTKDRAITPTAPYAEPVCEFRSVTEKMPVTQGKLAMGFKTGVCISDEPRLRYSMIVLNEIFGGSAASKLFMNVREKLSLCYYCSSFYNQYLGIMSVSSGIDNKNRAATEKAILSELEDIRKGKISDAELHAAKCALDNNYRQIYDSPYELQSFFGNRAIFGYSEAPDDIRREFQKITAEDVAMAARSIVLDSVFYVEGTADGKEELDDEA